MKIPLRLLLILCLFLFPRAPFAYESKILSKIGQYMPNLTEIGFVTNVINLYVQMSQYVRSTNTMVRNIENAKQQWDYTGQQLEQLYANVEALKNFNVYDMDTWSQTLENANNLILVDVNDLRQSFNMMEFYTLDAAVTYSQSLSTASEYDFRTKANRQVVSKYFMGNEYQSSLEQFQLLNAGYRSNTLELLRSRLQEERSSLALARTPLDKAVINARISRLSAAISMVEIGSSGSPKATAKIDSILSLASDLISVNLTEIQYSVQRLKSIENATAQLRDSYQRLVNGEVDVKVKDKTKPVTSVLFDINKYSATDPDNVPVPATPQNVVPKLTRKKQVSEQDILALENQIDFLALIQDAINRDVTTMKSNTMAFVVALEAFKQDKQEQQAFIAAHSAKMMEIALRDKK